MTRTLLACALAVFATACSAGRTAIPTAGGPDPRYLYQLLDARKLGAQELATIEQKVPAVSAWVAKWGHPDFIIQPGPRDIQLVYYARSMLVHFNQGSNGQWTSSQLTPLPSGLLNVLPSDIRAGTPPALGQGLGCWKTSVPAGTCQTCCAPPGTAAAQNCSIECKPGR